MPLKILLAFVFVLSSIQGYNKTPEYSRSKQQKFFPKALKKKDVYLGMTLAKLQKEAPNAKELGTASEFKIEYKEEIANSDVVAYHYLLTKEEVPQVYKIEIEYRTMEGVQPRAERLLGAPNHNNEWRITSKEIKEDFTMGIWTFGHKLVYGATLKNSEWEKGFDN